MSFVSITITVLVLLIMLSLYYNYKFAMIIFRIEDAIEDFETVDFSKIRVRGGNGVMMSLGALRRGGRWEGMFRYTVVAVSESAGLRR